MFRKVDKILMYRPPQVEDQLTKKKFVANEYLQKYC